MLTGNLKNKITNTGGVDLELEARFGSYKDNKFISDVKRQTFNRIKAYFDQNSTKIDVRTTDYIMGKVRKSVDSEGNTVWITKERVWVEDDKNYGIRYSMAREISVEPIITHFKPVVIREKNRSSYLIFNNSVRIDITQVNQMFKGKDTFTFEVEIELIDRKSLDKFEKAVIIVSRLVLDTVLPYTKKERDDIINEVNYILGSDKKGFIDHYPLVQARNLKLGDMVYGGLIGNGKTGYSVTHKADGIRKMLVFLKSGIWLISTSSISKISSQVIPRFNGTILDGELVPKDKRLEGAPNNYFWFLAFDTLAWDYKSVQNKGHFDRLQYAQTISDNMKTDLIYVNTKSFTTFETPSEFFKVMRDMFNQQLVLPYKQDGFMFTPQNTVYNPHSDKMPLYKRKLSDYPDICKWKPKDELTIDLQIKWKAGNILELYSNEKGNPVLFTKFDKIDSENIMTLNLPSNTIVEYRYDYERDMLVPTRIRFDKEKPNRRDVAEDVANDILNPIEEETMKGNNFTLLRKYHNLVKKNLFNSVKGRTLLDIGSGYGGDLGKWKGYEKIVAVEPDSEHIDELRKRLKTYDMEDNVKIVLAGGQETEKITDAVKEWIGDRVDTVSSMLSLTFFWQNPGLIDSLVQTIVRNIKPEGKYIFLTMDGDLVEQTFDPAFDTGQSLKKLKLGPATLEYNDKVNPKELYIDIEGTIVEKQKEWLVRLDDLRIRFEKYGFEIFKIQKADEEKFLTDSEIIMTQMYTYGGFKQIKDGKLPDEAPNEKLELPKIVEKLELPKIAEKLELPKIVEKLELPKIAEKLELPKIAEKLELPKIAEKLELPKIAEKLELPKISKKLPEKLELPKLKSKEIDILSMDKVEKINITWWENPIIRIGNLKDENSFFHSVLNSYLKYYQTNSNVDFREKFAKDLKLEIENLNLVDEIFSQVSEILNIDIYVMRLKSDDLILHKNTYKEGSTRRSIVILDREFYLETLGLEKDSLYQTLFDYNDPFIEKIKNSQK